MTKSCRLIFLFTLTLTFISFSAITHTGNTAPKFKEKLYSNSFLLEEPTIEISPQGIVTVIFNTKKTCKGGEAFIGIFPDDLELRYPVLRKRGKMELVNSTTVKVKFQIAKLENKGCDINQQRQKRQGDLSFRCILFGEKQHTYDRCFSYARDQQGRYFRAPAICEGPFIDCVTDSSAVISWAFDQLTDSYLIIQSDGLTKLNPEVKQEFEVPVSGLRPAATYRYRIHWSESDIPFHSREFSFNTAPEIGSDEAFRFAVLSDSRATYGGGDRSVEGVNQTVMNSLLNQTYQHKVSFILMPGDLVSGYVSDPAELENEFRSLKRIIAPVGSLIPIYEGMGNHDLALRFFEGDRYRDFVPRSGEEASEVIFAKHFVNPENGPEPYQSVFPPYKENVYSFDWGNAHIVMLNNNYMEKGESDSVAHLPGELEGVIRPEQLDWLDKDLQNARSRGLKHLFVALHEPAFPNSAHVEDAMFWDGERPEILKMRDRFWKILCKYEVLAAFFGHEHNYSRALIDSTVNPDYNVPIWQIITGGAGGPFYKEETDTPWSHTVKKFYPLTHLCLLEVEGDKVTLTVKSGEGFEIERVILNEH